MIDDYIENGLTEEEAVERMGSADEVAAQILSDIQNQPASAPDKPFLTRKRNGIIPFLSNC